MHPVKPLAAITLTGFVFAVLGTSFPYNGGDVDDYMGVVSRWRGAMELPVLTKDDTLQSYSQKTVDNSVGGQLIHELNLESKAQLLARGNANDLTGLHSRY